MALAEGVAVTTAVVEGAGGGMSGRTEAPSGAGLSLHPSSVIPTEKAAKWMDRKCMATISTQQNTSRLGLGEVPSSGADGDISTGQFDESEESARGQRRRRPGSRVRREP
jgi:hypothetical protein